ncbi:cation:proton antiporter [Streptomyces sp. NPDC056254]|uniref:cation:proton antiporter domain-containing protein n=1 Tax=unclassified Streptomyces TaxID=2593676 RepID=UPI0004AB171C|nr:MULTISPECIES: cation:proton antiporter [unclassified Streptomyces]APU39156.1 cation transporter [Streptomyces sp. TN58]KJK54082.1 cation transporter [Streptomyces sp. NRRL F-4428]
MTLSDAVYLAAGIGALGAAVLPRLVFRRPLSMPMVFLAAGALVALLPVPVPVVDPQRQRLWVEHATEVCVIVSLMGAGLALNRAVGRRSWSGTWRLLGISLPLTIAGMAAAAAFVLGWPPAPALLLAAVLSPTDPVLAAEVRVGEPTDEDDDEDEVRFCLTSEAGLNDGLAFPFVLAAVALAAVPAGQSATAWISHWVLVDVLARIAIGVAVGVLTGRLLGLMFFRARPSALRLSEHMEGFVALGATFTAYGATELLQGYGFLAVFVTACTIRAAERSHGYHKVLHEFTEQIERLLTAFLLFLLGGYLVVAGLPSLTWREAVVALVLVLVVRPAAGWVGLLGGPAGRRERVVIAAFGIRGIGSMFYLAYALGHSDHFGSHEQQLWTVVAFTVMLSVLLHGATATPVIRRLDRLRDASRTPP